MEKVDTGKSKKRSSSSRSKLSYLEKKYQEKKKSSKRKKKQKREKESLSPPLPDDDCSDENASNSTMPVGEMDGPVVVETPLSSSHIMITTTTTTAAATSNSAVPSSNPRRKRRRYDSSEDESDHPKTDISLSSKQIKQEAESPVAEISSRRRKRYDSEDEEDSDASVERMSSGHKAGLQTGNSFSSEQAVIDRRRKQETEALLDQHGVGDTTVRRGIATTTKTKQKLTEAQQQAINSGTVQKLQRQLRDQELQQLQNAGFARYADDATLEAQRKAMLRKDDPMAAYDDSLDNAKSSSKNKQSHPRLPVYKGPPAKPNRFQIRPGFRWDGVDRGNGFEDKLLAQRFSKQYQQEQAYKRSVADM